MSLNNKYSQNDRETMLKLAKASIQQGLTTHKPMKVDLEQYPGNLTKKRATFVTLTKNAQLRGCIGILEAVRPLVEDISENAFSAAFKDPRFSPLQEFEYKQLEIHISILNPSEPILFTSESDLIAQLRPGIDGLILEQGIRRGTFLPSVWESLPDAQRFLCQLKQKAGLPEDYWSETLKIYRYTAEYVG